MLSHLMILALAYVQNISFTMVSRSRNRDNMAYHACCAVFSNLLWFATMHHLVATNLTWTMAVPYVIGTVAGSLTGAGISIRIENLIGAKT